MALFSLQVEKHALGGLIQNPEVISEVDRFVKDRDFVSEPHNVIYSCIRSSYLNNEKIDKVLLAQKIKNLGISFKDDINIFDYIDSISFTPVTPEATIKSCQEVVKLRALRDIEKTAERIKQKVNQSANQELGKTIGEVDSLYAEQIGSFETEVEPDDLFSDIYEMVEDTGNHPMEEVGMKTPFPEFNRMYGGLRGGNFYAFASRAKSGKAVRVGTPILTTNGFAPIEEIKVGDKIYTPSGETTKVLATKHWKNRRTYKVTINDGNFVYADENHDWTVRLPFSNDWVILDTKSLYEYAVGVDVTFDLPICSYPRSQSSKGLHPKRSIVKISKSKYSDTVCIQVDHPSHNFLCGEALIPTHNSTLLGHLAIESGKINTCPVLMLDTEMTSKEIKFRMAANRSGVPLWYLESGQWRKNKDMVDKVRQKLIALKDEQKVFHYYVGNKDVDQVCSIIRRWILKVVGRGKPCIIVYDYLKLTGEKLGANWAEHQALGDKVNKFKALSVEFNFPFLTAVQMNRSGESTGKTSNEMNDDSSSIAQSDRIMWFCTYLGIFRRKTEDEIALDTPESGTHKLIEIAARYQGRDAAGHQDWMRRRFPDGKTRNVHNYINFNIDNFNVEERGSLRDSIARGNAMYLVSDRDIPNSANETI
jgi:replicative DNA helicase